MAAFESTRAKFLADEAKHCPGVTPRINTNNGSQFVAKDFKEFIRQSGMFHAIASTY